LQEPSTKQSGLPSTDYYAPEYKIEVDGQILDEETKGDILDLKVAMDIDNMTSFDFTVNNWDDKNFDFKYSDKKTFNIGNVVHVHMGYADGLRSMVSGQISTLSPKFPESGPPTMAIRGLDGMFKLRDRQPAPDDVKKFVDKADWEIAQIVGERNGMTVEVTKEGVKHDLVVQKNQDDAIFIVERAKRIDFDCYVRTNPDSGESTLFFVKPTDARSGDTVHLYTFEWGTSLINFNPQLTLSSQVSKVTVRGWDPRTKSPIVYTSKDSDLPPPPPGSGTSGPQSAQTNLNGKQQVVVDAPVTSQQEAQDLAVSLLRERAYEFITGTGQVIGLPDLRPGYNLELKGLGKRFSGDYYIKKVEHSLGASGYLSRFEVRRVYDGGTV
jgi:phage protein D